MDNRNHLLKLSERPPGKRLGLGRLEVSVSPGGDQLTSLSARLPYQKRKTPKKLSRNTSCSTKFFDQRVSYCIFSEPCTMGAMTDDLNSVCNIELH